jgi:hypothetical protein
MRTHYLTARGARWRTSCVQSEKMPHALAVSFLLAKGEREGGQWRKCLTVVVFRIGLIAERRARTCFVRHPRSDIKLS